MTSIILSASNLLDTATLTPSAEVTGLEADKLKSTIIADRWRVTATGGNLVADLGADVDGLAVLALFIHPDSPVPIAGDTIRWQIYTAAAGTGGIAAYDSGAVAFGMASRFGAHFHQLATPVAGRYVKMTFSVPSMAARGYFEAGRLWIGAAPWQPSRNFTTGWQRRWRGLSDPVDRAEQTRAQFARTGDQARQIRLAFPALVTADAEALDDLAHDLGGHGQFLACLNPDAPARTTLLARFDESPTITQPGPDRFAASFTIEESK